MVFFNLGKWLAATGSPFFESRGFIKLDYDISQVEDYCFNHRFSLPYSFKNIFKWYCSHDYKMNDVKEIYNKIIKEIRGYFQKNNVKKAVIGLSGGIDSSLSAKLVADAIGRENVHGIMMPVKGLSSDENIKDAADFCSIFN